MNPILYAVIIATTLFAGIFLSTYFKDLKSRHRMAKANKLKAITINKMH